MKININDEMSINKAMKKVEKGCSARLITYQDIIIAAKKAEYKLEALKIPRVEWRGCTVSQTPPALPKSYSGEGEGTYFTLQRGAKAWFLIHIDRAYCRKRSFGGPVTIRLVLTDQARQAIPKEFGLE